MSLRLASASLLALATLLVFAPRLGAQGSLTPAGGPAPTGRTLDQLEPRTPIPASGPFPYLITQRGSYYLTGNVSVASGNAIVIQTSDVNLDLGGFTIASTSGTLSGNAILLDTGAANNISIANGFIRGTTIYNTISNAYSGGGFGVGIASTFQGSLGPNGVRVSSLGISGVGDGIQLNPNSPSNVVEKTTVASVQGAGIRAGVVADSSADRTGGVSIEARSTSNVAGSRTTAGDPILPVPVAPLVRTDIEPRTAIPGGSATVVISTPGSYVLTGNVTVASGDGLTVNADNVTLDLNGYTVASTAASPTGFAIHLAGGRTNVAIANGHLRGTRVFSGGSFSGGGFTSGIDYSGATPRSVRVSNVSVTGVGSFGIDLGVSERSSSIVQCTVRTAGSLGLRAGSVADSAALEIGGGSAVVAGSVSNVFGTLTGAGTPVSATDPTVASVGAQVGVVDTKVGVLAGDVTAARNEIAAVQSSVDALNPRTVIPAGGAYTISAPGSYVLSGNITVASGSGLTIAADNVSLDLNGFTIASTGTSAVNGTAGILLSGARKRLAIANGIIRGVGFYRGISSNGTVPTDVRVTNVSVSDVFSDGINLSYLGSNLVTASTVTNVGGDGINANTVVGCMVFGAADSGIFGGTVTGSSGTNTAGLSSVSSITNPSLSSVAATVAQVQTALTESSDKRTQIPGGSTPFVISTGGSYVLTGDLTVATGDGIQIIVSNVTLDLNGFTLRSNAGSATGSGIFVGASNANITIRNGRVVGGTGFNGTSYLGGGFFHGVFVTDSCFNVRLEQLSVSNLRNGLVGFTTDLTSSAVACSASLVANLGISATTVSDCTVARAGGPGIQARTASGCRAASRGGIALEAEAATNCEAASSSPQTGLVARTALNCVGLNTSSGTGLFAVTASNSRGVAVSGTGLLGQQQASGCYGETQTGTGLSAGVASQCTGVATGAGIGLQAGYGISCTGSAGPGGTPLQITLRYLMP
ncbi:MAG: hypothetical protein JSR82_05580 [Verrucomicrobia bacterium]|nr:hypothetical protein [Verrucomicrobiota bacterium]